MGQVQETEIGLTIANNKKLLSERLFWMFRFQQEREKGKNGGE